MEDANEHVSEQCFVAPSCAGDPHGGRPDLADITARAIKKLQAAGLTVRMLSVDSERYEQLGVEVREPDVAAADCELALVFGETARSCDLRTSFAATTCRYSG